MDTKIKLLCCLAVVVQSSGLTMSILLWHTTLVEKPEDLQVSAGASAAFRCTPQTDPELTLEVTWLFKNESIYFINNERVKMANDNSLLISNVTQKDAGVYTCVVRTEQDQVRAKATLTVLDKPNNLESNSVPFMPRPVTNFNAYPLDTALLLHWEKPLDDTILTGYKVYYAKILGTEVQPLLEMPAVIYPASDHTKLSGLEPGTKYRVEVRATSEAGEGRGYFLEERTRFQPLLPLPVTVTDEPAKSANKLGSMLVRWIPDLDRYPDIRFEVSYREKGKHWQIRQPMLNDKEVTISDLKPAEYEVKVTTYALQDLYLTESVVKEVTIGKYAKKLFYRFRSIP